MWCNTQSHVLCIPTNVHKYTVEKKNPVDRHWCVKMCNFLKYHVYIYFTISAEHANKVWKFHQADILIMYSIVYKHHLIKIWSGGDSFSRLETPKPQCKLVEENGNHGNTTLRRQSLVFFCLKIQQVPSPLRPWGQQLLTGPTWIVRVYDGTSRVCSRWGKWQKSTM